MITFISKHLYFEKVWSSQFCWHHQNSNYIYLKKSLKTQKKLKNQNLFTKTQSISEFSDIAKLADFWWKNADISRNERVCHVIHVNYYCAKFHHGRICVTNVREEGPFCPPPPSIPRVVPKSSILNRVKILFPNIFGNHETCQQEEKYLLMY